MAVPKSLAQPFRKGNLLVGGSWRGYFATFNTALAATQTSTVYGPTLLDLQVQGPFSDAALPAGFYDLGWIDKFKFTPASKTGQVRSGYRGAVRAQYRGQVGETFEFSFREMTRTALKVASGSQIFNLLSNPAAAASTVGPLSSSGAVAVAMAASGYMATSGGLVGAQYTGLPVLWVPAGSGAQFFTAGSVVSAVVCDLDYTNGTYGYVGESGSTLLNATATTDVDFIRKTSDFVSRVIAYVSSATSGLAFDALILSKPFVGGGNSTSVSATVYNSPPPGSKVQAVKGYLAREGGSYISEWTALFLCNTIDGAQIALYYPHASASAFKGFTAWQLENAGTTDLTGYELDCTMEALAFDDPLDGETVVRYAAFYPNPTEDITI